MTESVTGGREKSESSGRSGGRGGGRGRGRGRSSHYSKVDSNNNNNHNNTTTDSILRATTTAPSSTSFTTSTTTATTTTTNGSTTTADSNSNNHGPLDKRTDKKQGRGRGRSGRGGRTTNNNSNAGGRGRGGRNNSSRGGRGRGRGRGGRGEGDTSFSAAAEDGNDVGADSNGNQSQFSNSNGTNATTTYTMNKTTLSLPVVPPNVTSPKSGVPMILTRNNSQHQQPPAVSMSATSSAATTEELHISERLAAAALEDDDDDDDDDDEPVLAHSDVTSMAATSNSNPIVTASNGISDYAENNLPPEQQDPRKSAGEKKKKPERKKKRRQPKEEPPPPPSTPVVEEVSTTDALSALPAQEVSITSASLVKVRKVDSSGSLSVLDASAKQALDKKNNIAAAARSGKGKKKGLTGDNAADQKAARHFNRSVRNCVERSDPDAMRELLRNKRNHNFALEATVLETVLKAYIMAAMFDDALYCLRNCTLPGTLSTVQAERILLCLPQNLRNSSAFTAADMINALCIATEFDVPTKRTYFLRIVRGIALEFLEEATSARDRICSAPCERLVRSAQCVVDARLKRGKKPTEILVDPGHQLGVFVPDTMENRGIQAGDAVSILPYAGPYPMSAESLDRNMIEATVTNTNPMMLRLQDKSNSNLYAMLTEPVDGNVYRVDKLANRMGFNRQLAAAVAFVAPIVTEDNNSHNSNKNAAPTPTVRDIKRPSPELIKAVTAMDENINRVMMRGASGFGEMTSTAALCSQPVPWNDDDDATDFDSIRDSSRLALEQYGAFEGLNPSQRLAVEGAATNRLTLVQGPPGTGKTQVAIRILRHWAKLASSQSNGDNPFPILATSDSNIAVDNLVEGCANVGLRVIRLGRPEAIRPELLRFCIDRPPQGGKGNNNNNNQSNNNSGTGPPLSASAFKEKIKQIRNAQVVCCTCIGSGGDILENMVFERVLVDEATQATEPAVLVPLARGCRQLVLVGDHCQLPPTVLSTRAEEEGLGVPLFSRMVACGVPPFMLDTQYRMHPAIAMFPSDLFYGGKLANGVSAPERRPLAGFPWPREEFPVAFVPVHAGVEVDDGVSKLNEAEAAAAYDAVEALLKGGQCRISDIAVVTPYAAQARLIRRMLRQLTQSHQGYVEVSSVDGFQGREKEAVVFSAVRSNQYGGVGFVKDWRRVNVSFTRARRALIVIGNDVTLRRGDPDTWMPWLAWADAHGINMDKPGLPRGRYEPEQLRRVRGGTTAAEMLKDVLARQQAQLKTAERQLQNAERNAAGHIMGKEEDKTVGSGDTSEPIKTLEQDLADMATDNWDDDDDSDNDGHVPEQVASSSQPTLSAVSSLNDFTSSAQDDGPTDAWDL